MRRNKSRRRTSSAPKVQRVEQVAYHEAGHAVLAFEMRRRIVSVTVQPGVDYWGVVINGKLSERFRPDIETNRSTRATIEREALIFFAGCAAQSVRVGKDVYGGAEGDFAKAVNLIDYLCGSPEEVSAYANWLWVRTKNSVRMPMTWTMIAMLADELLKRGTMSGREVRVLLLRVQRDVVERRLPLVERPVLPVSKARAAG